MTAHSSSKTYLAIYGWLMVLTILEVGIVLLGWPRAAIVIFLIGTALAKAMLIALFFMHLKFDRPAVWALPGIPVVLAVIFVATLFPDLVFHLALRH
ncbi:MAG: cytochrome C oxidase subunit IV family protein [Candidatus Omnitrophica bacterium]|nr:cytochrome C oxidase subunit IV family protein [Candidatus Omnitrophota bacterium]